MWFRVLAAFVLAVPAGLIVRLALAGLEPAGTSAGPSPSAAFSEDVPRLLADVDPEVRFAPVPDFVVPVEVPAAGEAANAFGVHALLFDFQQTTERNRVRHFFRQVLEPATQQGADSLRQVPIPIDPASNQVEIHHVLRITGDETIDMTENVRVDFLRGETALAQGIYTGAVTVMVRIPGVEPGERVEVAFSINQYFPIEDSEMTAVYQFRPMQGYDEVHFRADWPVGAAQVAAFGPAPELAIEENNGRVIASYGPAAWTSKPPEAFTPAWRHPDPIFLASAYDDWSHVARWANDLFLPVDDPQVTAIANEIMAEHAERDARIMAALRYVQREISYFAITLGEGGYRPVPPAHTLRFREGDCKAKTVLLISLLAEMGIESHAALVHSTMGRALGDMPATPLAFDHVIVTLEYGNRRLWLDPTMMEQTGRLLDHHPVDWGHALILEDGMAALTELDVRPRRTPDVDVREVFSIASSRKGEAAAVLRADWVYHGDTASLIETILAQAGMDQLGTLMQEFYRGRFESLEFVGEPELARDEEAGTVTISAEIQVDLFDFSSEGARLPTYVFVAHASSRSIVFGDLSERVSPLAMPYPYDVRHHIEVNLPEGGRNWIHEWEDVEIENNTFSITDRRRYEDGRVRYTARTRIMAPEAMPEDFVRLQNDLVSIDGVGLLVLGEQEDFVIDDAVRARLITPSVPAMIR